MAGGGNQQTTGTTTSEPWKASQPALQQGIKGAQNLYNAGVGGQVYTGSTVVPWSSQTTQAMGNIENAANANTGGKGLSGQYQNVINNGGLTSDQSNALNGLYGIQNSGGMNPTMSSALSGFQNVANQGGYNDATKAAASNFQNAASGTGYNDAMNKAMSGFSNLASNPFNSYQQSALQNTQGLANSQYSVSPELQKVLDAQASKVSDSVNMNASAAGRYGSGANQSLLAKNVGDLANQTIYNDYTNFLNRKDAANNNLFNMGQQGINTQASANSSIGSLGQSAFQNRQNAASNLATVGQGALANSMSALGNAGNIGQNAFQNLQNAIAGIGNMGQQGFSNLGTAYTGMQAPNTDLMNVGAMNEDLATRLKNDELRIFNESQNKPWELLGRMNAIASGAGQMGGTQTQTQPGQNPFLTALGYGSSGLGLLGSFL